MPTTQTPAPRQPQSGLYQRPTDVCTFVIFGASGDLTRRKLIPALYNLASANLLPPKLNVIGFASTEMTDDGFRDDMRSATSTSPEASAFHEETWETFGKTFRYITATFDADAGYAKLAKMLSAPECSGGRLFYLATPPSFYATIVANLGKAGLVTPDSKPGTPWTRVIIEKPFGRDLQSAIDLNASIHQVLSEDQTYRIDHYLGKETVQNIMAFRFANSFVEPTWNRRYVDHVQITAAETLGVEHRGKYYEEAGCLRDMFQNHLLQVLSIVAMEPPVRYGGSSIRDRKADVLRAVVPINPEELAQVAVRGQYGAGTLDGVNVPAYRSEDGVAQDSRIETFAALKLFVDNWRWADVPFYLRSGKRMAAKRTEVVIQYKRVPHVFFQLGADDELEPNRLTIRVAPDEGISLRFGAKQPGPAMSIKQVEMDFAYATAFRTDPATAYETLLLDAMLGDPTLFNRADAVELAWNVIEPVLDIWSATRPYQPFPNYNAGTWGPDSADELLQRDGRCWVNEAEETGAVLTVSTR